MKKVLLLSCLIDTIAYADNTANNQKQKLITPPGLLKNTFTVTDVRVTVLDGYTPILETNTGLVKLPKQSIDSLNYTVRIDSTDEKIIRNVVKDDYGVKGLLVCNNLSIRPLIMSKKAVVIVEVENSEGEPLFVTVYDNRSCKKK